MVKLTMNGGKKKRGRQRKTQTQSKPKPKPKPKPKQKKDKKTKNKPRTKPCKCEKKMSEIVDKVIDNIESIKRKNDNNEIEDLLLNSIDDLHKVYRLFKRIEDPSYLQKDAEGTEEEEPLSEEEEEPLSEEEEEEPLSEEEEEPVEKEEPVEPEEEEEEESLSVEEKSVEPEKISIEGLDADLFNLMEDSTSPEKNMSESPKLNPGIEGFEMTPRVTGGSRKKLKNILDELNNN